jgi:hypothetical protein
LVLGLSAFVVTRVTDLNEESKMLIPIKVGPDGEVTLDAERDTTAEGGATDAAQTVVCATTAQTLRAAEESYRLLNGRYADLPTLIASGTIRAPAEDLYAIESDDGYTTFRLVGRPGCP